MRSFTFLFVFMTCMFLQAADTLSISYCAGKLATVSTYGRDSRGEVSAAIYIPASTVGKYAGNNLVSIKAGLTSRLNIDSLKVWVRSSLDGVDLASAVIRANGTPKLLKGWNQATLEKPLTLTEKTGDLYIGYTYYARNRSYAVSVVGEKKKGTSFVNTAGNWEDLKDAGVPSIEGLIAGENLPNYDLALTYVAIGPDQAGGNTYYADMRVSNVATNSVSAFDVEVSRDNKILATIHCDKTLGSNEQAKIYTSFSPTEPIDPSDIVLFTITEIAEGADTYTGNNSCEASFIFERNVLVEEFTTERCSNCPRVAEFLHTALHEKPEYETRVTAVCHHSGFLTDWLTQACDNDLLELFTDVTYAPAVAINRMPYFTNNQTGKDDNVFIPESSQGLMDYFDSEMKRGADCHLNIQAEANADTSKVTLTITGQKNLSFDTADKYLTVYILEDNIAAQAQSGATKAFTHNHVIRAFNSSWGDEIEWNGNTFSMNYTFDINKGNNKAENPRDVDPWKVNDLQFVAIIAQHDPNNKLGNQVENLTSCRFNNQKKPSSICTEKQTAPAVETARYDLTGHLLEVPTKGLNIVRYSDGSVKKEYIR